MTAAEETDIRLTDCLLSDQHCLTTVEPFACAHGLDCELLERHLFFAAVVAPKMPGVAS